MNSSKGILLLSHLHIQNANAISGPLTWGFPSPTAFTGFVHALSRHIPPQYPIKFGGVGIICHRFEPQVTGTYNKVFNLARHPAGKPEGKDGETKPSAFIEEGRAHLEISLVIEAHGYLGDDEKEEFVAAMLEQAYSMRIAGGSILPTYSKKTALWQQLPDYEEDLDKDFKKFRRHLFPGFILVDRQDLLKSHLITLQKDREHATILDALLDLSRINYKQIREKDSAEKSDWVLIPKPETGWLVPIPVGYGAISKVYPAGEVANVRDENVPACFVESLYSLGQWISPHRFKSFSQLFWYHAAQPEKGQYLCVNNYKST